LNQRPFGPQPNALPDCATPRVGLSLRHDSIRGRCAHRFRLDSDGHASVRAGARVTPRWRPGTGPPARSWKAHDLRAAARTWEVVVAGAALPLGLRRGESVRELLQGAPRWVCGAAGERPVARAASRAVGGNGPPGALHVHPNRESTSVRTGMGAPALRLPARLPPSPAESGRLEAGDGNRTRTKSLEGSCAAVTPRPRAIPDHRLLDL
jgi:hypothetical protein